MGGAVEDDAAAARNFGWVSYVYIGAGGVIGLGLGDRSAGGEKMARMFFGGSCTEAPGRADCCWHARIRAGGQVMESDGRYGMW